MRSSFCWDIAQLLFVINEVSEQQIRPIGCPETSVTKYQSTLRGIPAERRSHPDTSFYQLVGEMKIHSGIFAARNMSDVH